MRLPTCAAESANFVLAFEREHELWIGVEIKPNQTPGHFVIELWPNAIEGAGPYRELLQKPDGRMLLTSACAKLGRVKAGTDWHQAPYSAEPPRRSD